MAKLFTNYLLVATLILLSACSSSQHKRYLSSIDVPATVTQLVEWENHANGAILEERSSAIFDLEHYEIPLRLLKKDFAHDLSDDVKESLIFIRDGEEYVRWIINPEDTEWRYEVEQFLEARNVDTTPKSYLKGHLSASRSLIAFNPENGMSFSVKVSTNKTGGNWKDKRQSWDDAKQIRKISDWIKEVVNSMKTETLVIMDEPLALGIEELDQGLIVRSLNDVSDGEKYYLPGFSALHETVGKDIAKLNGTTDVATFWNEHYNKPLAKALAEFSAYTGVYYDSPHSQNFMIELGPDMKPTGRIVLRDFGDAYVFENFVKNTDFKEVAEIWDQKNILRDKFRTSVGLLHGNTNPSWMDTVTYQQWGKDFYQEYERLFSEITGVPESELQQTSITSHAQFSYYIKQYSATSSSWKRYIEYANCLSGRSKTVDLKECLEIYKARQMPNSCASLAQQIML